MATTSQSGVRYALASVAALGTDFVLTLGLRTFTALPLSICAAISFIVVGVAFYFVHEHWSFKSDSSRSSPKRLIKNFLVLCASFTARVATIALLELVREPDTVLSVLYFGIGAGLSFTINFVANKLWVFGERQ